MKIEGQIKFKHAITVTDKLLAELEKIILEFYDIINFKAVLVNEDEIEFDSLDELLTYNNPNSRNIKNLYINARTEFVEKTLYISFDPSVSFLHNYKYSISGSFSINDNNEYVLLQNNLYSLLNRYKCSLIYTFLSKVSTMYISIVATIFGLFNYIKYGSKSSYIALDELYYIMIIIIVILLPFMLLIIKVWKSLFPPVFYKLGDQISKYNKINNLRNNILWTIIIGLGVGLVGTLIWDKIS